MKAIHLAPSSRLPPSRSLAQASTYIHTHMRVSTQEKEIAKSIKRSQMRMVRYGMYIHLPPETEPQTATRAAWWASLQSSTQARKRDHSLAGRRCDAMRYDAIRCDGMGRAPQGPTTAGLQNLAGRQTGRYTGRQGIGERSAAFPVKRRARTRTRFGVRLFARPLRSRLSTVFRT